MKKYIGTFTALVVGLGIGFYGGKSYQQKQTQQQFASRNGVAGTRQFTRDNTNGNRTSGSGAPIIGQITASDSNSITVKQSDGSSKVVVINSDTKISKTDTGAQSDLQNGVEVGVFGTTDSSGTITAQSVQLSPSFGELR